MSRPLTFFAVTITKIGPPISVLTRLDVEQAWNEITPVNYVVYKRRQTADDATKASARQVLETRR